MHTLIPAESGFAPAAEQVVGFLGGLSVIGASPRDSRLIVMKPSGRVRSFTDPLTGEKKTFPARDRIPLENYAAIPSAIEGLHEYSVAVDGHGPPPIPPFQLYVNGTLFNENYALVVRCCLRPEAVSMCDPYRAPYEADGVFRHPVSGNVIKGASAGYARLWVEFEFGKWLLPNTEQSLEILEPRILSIAMKSFGLAFTQGFHLL